MEQIKILLAGEGGQGIQALAKILIGAGNAAGLSVSYVPNYGVEQRGGVSLAYIQLSKSQLAYPKFYTPDILVVMVNRAVPRVKNLAGDRTKVLNCLEGRKILEEQNLPARGQNMLVLGILVQEIAGLVSPEQIQAAIKEKLGKKPGLEQNLAAFELGAKLPSVKFNEPLEYRETSKEPLITKGTKVEFYRWPYLCKGCGLCIERCPQKCLRWSQKDLGVYQTPMPEVDIEKCINCHLCRNVCPDGAIDQRSRINADSRRR